MITGDALPWLSTSGSTAAASATADAAAMAHDCRADIRNRATAREARGRRSVGRGATGPCQNNWLHIFANFPLTVNKEGAGAQQIKISPCVAILI